MFFRGSFAVAAALADYYAQDFELSLREDIGVFWVGCLQVKPAALLLAQVLDGDLTVDHRHDDVAHIRR